MRPVGASDPVNTNVDNSPRTSEATPLDASPTDRSGGPVSTEAPTDGLPTDRPATMPGSDAPDGGGWRGDGPNGGGWRGDGPNGNGWGNGGPNGGGWNNGPGGLGGGIGGLTNQVLGGVGTLINTLGGPLANALPPLPGGFPGSNGVGNNGVPPGQLMQAMGNPAANPLARATPNAIPPPPPGTANAQTQAQPQALPGQAYGAQAMPPAQARPLGNPLPPAPPQANANPQALAGQNAVPAGTTLGNAQAAHHAEAMPQRNDAAFNRMLGMLPGAVTTATVAQTAAMPQTQMTGHTNAASHPLLAQMQGSDPRVLPLPQGGSDRASLRPDTPLTPLMTLDGPFRRLRRRVAGADGQAWSQRRSALASLATELEEATRDTWFALRWLYWMLAIIAYGCLGFALVAFVGPQASSWVPDAANGSTALWIGLAASLGAVVVSRRLARKR